MERGNQRNAGATGRRHDPMLIRLRAPSPRSIKFNQGTAKAGRTEQNGVVAFGAPAPSQLPLAPIGAKLVPPTTPSADFSAAITSLTTRSVRCPGQRRSPEVSSTAFPARPPNLPPRPLMTMDFAISCLLVRSGRPRYPVFVHRAAGLLHASFRLRLATTPLRFANPSPSSGWVQDFHLQAVEHARHITIRPPW